MNVFDLRATLRLDDKEYTRGLGNAEARLQTFGRRAQQVGTTLSTRLSAPIAALGGGIVATATQFQASMNRVQGITQATGREFDALNALARELGETTQFSASQAADGMGFLAQAGFEVNEIMEALPGTLELAAAGQLSLAEAADLASNVLTGFGLEAQEIGRINDTLAKTATSTNTNVRQLGEAFSFVAPVAAGLGVSVEEAGAAIGVLSNAGIQGTRAGTGLRRVLTTLVNESDELGVAVTEADGSLRPFADIISDLEERGLSTAEALEIFGDRGGPAIATLLGEGSTAIQDLQTDLENAGGTAQDLADTQMQGLPGAFRELRSAVEGAALALADAGLADFVEDTADSLTNLTREFNDLDESMQRIVLLVGGGAAAAGPLLIGVGLLTRGVGEAIRAFRLLRGAAVLLAGPQAILVALAALVGTALVKAFLDMNSEVSDAERQAEDFRVKMGEVAETIGDNQNKDSLYGKVDNLAKFVSDENRNGWKEYARQAIESAGSVEEAEQQLTDSIKDEIIERELAALESVKRQTQQDLDLFSGEARLAGLDVLEAEQSVQNLRRQFGAILFEEDVDPALRQAAQEAIAAAEAEVEAARDRLAEAGVGGAIATSLLGGLRQLDLLNDDIRELENALDAVRDSADEADKAVQGVTGTGTPASGQQGEPRALPIPEPIIGSPETRDLSGGLQGLEATLRTAGEAYRTFNERRRDSIRLANSQFGSEEQLVAMTEQARLRQEALGLSMPIEEVVAANAGTSAYTDSLDALRAKGAEAAQAQQQLTETVAISGEQMQTIVSGGIQQFVAGITDLGVQAANTEATVGEAFALMALKVVDSILQQIIALQVRLIAEKLFSAGTLNFVKLGAAVAASVAIKGLANNLKNQVQSRSTASAPASSGVPATATAASPAANAVLERLDSSVERFGTYVERLVTEGIQVQLTGGGSGTAVLRGT